MDVVGHLWIDGELKPAAEATVSAVDHGVTVGDGVFETMKIVRGRAFALRRHLARLRSSAGALRLRVPFEDEVLSEAVATVIEANPGAGRIRLTLTGGPGPLGSDRGRHPPTTIIAAAPLVDWEPRTSVVVVPWRRNEHGALAGVKSTSYAENVIALEYAREQEASEAIFANTSGQLCEGTGTNVFVGIGGRLVTPPLSSGCLAGITRQLVLELVAVEERDIPISQLGSVDEAFLTSSTREVQPIEVIDGRLLPTCPGPLTAAAQRAFAGLMTGTTDP